MRVIAAQVIKVSECWINPRTQYFWRGDAVRALARTDKEVAVERVVAHFESRRSYTAGTYWDQAREALGLIAARRGPRAAQ
ncbi:MULTISPECIES: hypothetical protein [unclassified Streptomyces]|uniref:hypothetical protein n=1 Tax=unclassified Streptomyces TaxID=2593676 RepID=UPI002DDA9513|nr:MULTISPECIES: hypothetical protein [unclassified Streptomyces]WSA90763.1 hypothetical protein OIE63_03840 [Streptomyces sp. NBC_01795]WSS16633.1 hypothetical protein OG533_35535 [Streptomyces sp. NBC_01186]WSS45451.1 hypothetical protein OG220_36220 [Streptomyces sp. NBC_01187]